MGYWLLKTEADSYGWDDLVRDGETEWTGVRNRAAAANLRAMAVGDRALFYQSGADKAVVGLAEVTRAARKESEDGNWVSVRLRPVEPLAHSVTLAAMKADPALVDMTTLRQPRLSVAPVRAEEWRNVLNMGKAST